MEQNIYNLSTRDHEQITDAIRAAEKKTSGEIFAVVAHQSDDYFFVAGFIAAVWSLVLGLIVALVLPDLLAIELFMALIAAFASFLLVFHFFPEWRLLFVPKSLGYRRASGNAVRQFLAHGIHATSDRSGILIFVSLAERYAEVVADEGINSKVPQEAWNEMVATLTQHAAKGELSAGYLLAIEQAGELLAAHFPPTKGQKSELDDRLVEI